MGMSPVFAEMSCDHFLNGFRFCSLLFGYFFPVVFVFFFFDAFLAFTLVRQRLQLAVKRQRSPSRGENHCFQKPRGSVCNVLLSRVCLHCCVNCGQNHVHQAC